MAEKSGSGLRHRPMFRPASVKSFRGGGTRRVAIYKHRRDLLCHRGTLYPCHGRSRRRQFWKATSSSALCISERFTCRAAKPLQPPCDTDLRDVPDRGEGWGRSMLTCQRRPQPAREIEPRQRPALMRRLKPFRFRLAAAGPIRTGWKQHRRRHGGDEAAERHQTCPCWKCPGVAR